LKTTDIDYSVGGTKYIGYLAVDEARAGKRPGVLLAPEGPGLGDLCKSFARKLADLGYVAYAMDYHGGGKVVELPEAMGRIQAFMANPQGIRDIATTALGVLKSQPQTDTTRLAAIGYCFGGTTALELARSGADLKAAVGFHSGLGTARPQDAANIKAKILVNIGADDPIIPKEQRVAFEQEMTAAKVDWRMNLYGGAGHSFTNPDVGRLGRPGFAYHEPSDRRSWKAMLDLFDEVFGKV
jgi:dienelactone hydrolase